MFWKKKNTTKNECICEMCKTSNLKDDYKMRCNLCQKFIDYNYIYSNKGSITFNKESAFVLNYGLSLKGSTWFKKARDKLIKKYEQYEKNIQLKRDKKNQKIIDTINKWK